MPTARTVTETLTHMPSSVEYNHWSVRFAIECAIERINQNRNDGEWHCSYNSNCIADLCDIIMLLFISQYNLIKVKLYDLQKSTFDVI